MQHECDKKVTHECCRSADIPVRISVGTWTSGRPTDEIARRSEVAADTNLRAPGLAAGLQCAGAALKLRPHAIKTLCRSRIGLGPLGRGVGRCKAVFNLEGV